MRCVFGVGGEESEKECAGLGVREWWQTVRHVLASPCTACCILFYTCMHILLQGWEGCGQGVNGTQHDKNGDPVIDKKRFPDIAGLVKYGHERGLKVGWYENGCACGEKTEIRRNYQGDIRTLHALGFDGVKLDGCGAQRNLTFYAELMKASGKVSEQGRKGTEAY